MKNQNFGGAWTEKKLSCVKRYIVAYEKVMKNQNFTLLYIDAFAGPGYRAIQKNKSAFYISGFQKGSPVIILENTDTFNEYIFIEKHLKTFQNLKKLESKYPEKKIVFKNEDANYCITDLCNNINWRNHRAILFLDPFAMEVKWTTISTIAQTKAIDLWILFPAMAVNRLLFKNKKIPEKLQNQLNTVFGSSEWKEYFYQESPQLDWFGKNRKSEKVASFESIKSFYLKKLRTVFPGVAPNPLPLKNSKGSILFYLCFAVSNERGKMPALNIAKYILEQQ